MSGTAASGIGNPAVQQPGAGCGDRAAGFPSRLDEQCLLAHVHLHAEIDATAAELKAWVALVCMTARRAIGQEFGWAFRRRRAA